MIVKRKKTEGTSSARFGLRIAAKCDELKRCADRVGSRTDTSTFKTTEYSVELLLSIYRNLISN